MDWSFFAFQFGTVWLLLVAAYALGRHHGIEYADRAWRRWLALRRPHRAAPAVPPPAAPAQTRSLSICSAENFEGPRGIRPDFTAR
jgi:hypothetical protein